jgi:tRNA A-37 threonylcarbamoyl transferase component Bud32
MTEQGTIGQSSGGTGRTVGRGRYLLRDLLGQGGMATVHLADDTVLDRPVAVKSMLGDMSREPSFRERFRREAQAVARLNHTNIVAVYDSGEDVNDDGLHVPFIVMEYVEGGSLSSVLREDMAAHGAMPTDKALKITGDVLSALSASHEQGLVHRDIKPANVMLTRRGVVKVMDFGIARAMQSGVTSMTQTGMVVGTPQYLSPEQALGKPVDARSDLYSVGCLLFELLTGRLPFESDSALGMAYQHVQETPPAPSSLNAAVPPGVDALVARALRKDPAHRFPSADAMREECERLAGTGGTGANTPLIIGGGPRVGGPGGVPGSGQDRGGGWGWAAPAATRCSRRLRATWGRCPRRGSPRRSRARVPVRGRVRVRTSSPIRSPTRSSSVRACRCPRSSSPRNNSRCSSSPCSRNRCSSGPASRRGPRSRCRPGTRPRRTSRRCRRRRTRSSSVPASVRRRPAKAPGRTSRPGPARTRRRRAPTRSSRAGRPRRRSPRDRCRRRPRVRTRAPCSRARCDRARCSVAPCGRGRRCGRAGGFRRPGTATVAAVRRRRSSAWWWASWC